MKFKTLPIPAAEEVRKIPCSVCGQELDTKAVVHWMLSARHSNDLGTLAHCVKAGRICLACWLRADVGPVVQVALGLRPADFLKAEAGPEPRQDAAGGEQQPPSES